MQNEKRLLRNNVKQFIDTKRLTLPDSIMFEPTQRCNLRCKMCYQDRSVLADQKELSLDQIISFFDQNRFLKKVTLIGGEIFIRNDMMDLISCLNQTRDIVISTNGTLLGDSEIELLKSFSRVFTVCISLDGSKEVHESIRGVKGSYNKTVNSIKALAPFLPVTVTCVIQNDNLNMLPEIVQMCSEMGVKKIKLELERIYGRKQIEQTIAETGLETKDIPISSTERMREYSFDKLKSVLDECENIGRKCNIHVAFDPAFLMDELASCYDGILRSKKKCLCQSFRMMTLEPNGNVINCFVIRKSFGNILDSSLEQIWNSESASKYRRQLIENNLTALCENCTFLRPCH